MALTWVDRRLLCGQLNCIVKIVSGNITPITAENSSGEGVIVSSKATLTGPDVTENTIVTIPAGTSIPVAVNP